MIAKTDIKQVSVIVALVGISFYAGTFRGGDQNSRTAQAEEVSALKSRIGQLEAQLQTLNRQEMFERPADLPDKQGNDLLAIDEPEAFPGNEESLFRARQDIWSDVPHDRVWAIETLIRLSPAEAIDALRLIMSQADDGEDLSFVASSLRQLANNQYLLNADLKQFYNSGDEQLQRAAADALAQRGDDSLQRRYINEQSTIASQNTDPVRRAEAVQKLTAFGKNPQAASQILPLLEDPDSYVRLKAVSALAYTGDHSSIPAVQALLDDEVAAVRQRAEEVISALNLNGNRGLILIPPPGMIPND